MQVSFKNTKFDLHIDNCFVKCFAIFKLTLILSIIFSELVELICVIKSIINPFTNIYIPDSDGDLWIPLADLASAQNKVVLWVAQDWLNEEKRISTKRILIDPSYAKG